MLAGPRPTDLLSEFALPVAIGVICELLGVPEHDADHLHWLSLILGSRTAALEPVRDATDRLAATFGTMLKRPRIAALGGVVADHWRAGRVDAEAALNMLQILFHAGHGPTAHTIGVGVLALAQHPGSMEHLQSTHDPDFVASAVGELLRYTSVSHNGAPRVATDDIDIGGQLIRKGDGALIQLDSANRDETVFADPDRLDFRRPARRQLALGHGIHNCIGGTLADVELQVAFTVLLRRIPALRLAVPMGQLRFN